MELFVEEGSDILDCVVVIFLGISSVETQLDDELLGKFGSLESLAASIGG